MKKMPLFYHEANFSWYNSFQAGRFVPMANYTIPLTLHGIIAAKRLLYLFLWPDDAQALPAPVPMADYTTSLTLHGIIACTPAGTDRRRGQTDKNRTGKASVPSWGQGDLHQPIIA